MSHVFIILGSINIAVGVVLLWLIMDDSLSTSEEKDIVSTQKIKQVLTMPVVWMIAVIIAAAYTAHVGSYSLPAYATRVFEKNVVEGGSLNVFKSWLAPLCAIGAGFLADRTSICKVIAGAFVLLIVSFAGLAILPKGSLYFIVIANTALISLGVFVLRGVFLCFVRRRKRAIGSDWNRHRCGFR